MYEASRQTKRQENNHGSKATLGAKWGGGAETTDQYKREDQGSRTRRADETYKTKRKNRECDMGAY